MQTSILLSAFSLSLKLQTYTAKLIINDIYYIFSKRIHIIYSILKEQGKIKMLMLISIQFFYQNCVKL